jgi:hypothetical protein
VPHIALDDTSLRTSNQSLEPTFQIEIEGAPCFLACSCLRSRGSTRFESLNAILPNLPGWEGAGVLEHDGRPHAALIIPADTCDFSLDEGTLCQSLARDIGSGTVRWFFGIPMDHIDDDGMTMLEALSDVVRRRRLVASRGGLWMTGNIRDTMSMLKVPKRVLREGSPRSLLYDVLGRARIYGVTLNENGSPTVLRERVLDSLFVTVENAYIGISDAFAFISDNTDPGAITATRQGRSLETGLSGRKLKDVIVAPAWKKELPVLLDRPIREAVLSLATG